MFQSRFMTAIDKLYYNPVLGDFSSVISIILYKSKSHISVDVQAIIIKWKSLKSRKKNSSSGSIFVVSIELSPRTASRYPLVYLCVFGSVGFNRGPALRCRCWTLSSTLLLCWSGIWGECSMRHRLKNVSRLIIKGCDVFHVSVKQHRHDVGSKGRGRVTSTEMLRLLPAQKFALTFCFSCCVCSRLNHNACTDVSWKPLTAAGYTFYKST